MLSQQVNRINKKHSQDRYEVWHGAFIDEPITDSQTGFIHHPRGFPLHYKRLRSDDKDEQVDSNQNNIGLLFQSDKYLKPGTTIEVTIPLRSKLEKFCGKVVMVRNQGDYFEIGLWLNHREDASRVRIVEQLCHIEAYVKEKKFREGPYILNRERIAEEWISKNAGTVPSL